MMRKTLIMAAALLAVAFVRAQPANIRSESKAVVDGAYYHIHTVREGETVASLAGAYLTTPRAITDANPASGRGLTPGDIIKIPVARRTISSRDARRAEVHITNEGETAWSIARRYAVTLDDLISANPWFDPLNVKRGSALTIPRGWVGSATQTEVAESFERYAEALSLLMPGYRFHVAADGNFVKTPVSGEGTDNTRARDTAPGINPMALFPGGMRDREGAQSGREYSRGRSSEGFAATQGPRVAILLPFTSNGREEPNIEAFYNGALIALDDLKKEGVSASVTVLDTRRSPSEVERIFREGLVDGADLIIGPVYEEEFRVAARYAGDHRIPIVSPLAAVHGESNGYIYQATPGQEYREEKLKALLSGGSNVVVVTPSEAIDTGFMEEIDRTLPPGHRKIYYTRGSSISDPLRDALLQRVENIIIVPTSDPVVLNEIMTIIATLQNHVTSRSLGSYRIRTLGPSQWASFTDMDRSLFFKLGVMYLTNYHADRGNETIREFDSKFIERFSYLPEGAHSYAYRGRGYDVAKLFVSAAARGATPSNAWTELLQVRYHFVREGAPGGKWVNDRWTLVKYNPDFTISAE